MKNRPNKLWAVWGNGYGFRGPLLVTWSEELQSWWARNGNDDIEKVGFHWDDGHFTFSSESRKEVETFANGYSACALIVREATFGHKKKNLIT